MKSPRVLVVMLSNIGDVILTTPVLSAVAARYPGHKITVVVGPRAKGVLEASPLVDRLVVYDKRAPLWAKWRFWREIARDSYACVVDLRNSAIPFLVRAGVRSSVFRFTKEVYMRARHLEVIRRMGFATENLPRFDFFGPEQEASALSKLKAAGGRTERGWIAVSPIAASGLKTWRRDGFAAVFEKFLKASPAEILLLGGERERELCEPLARIDASRIFNLAGLTTIPEAASLITRSALVLANDSSVAHLASELGVPRVVIFGPTDWKRYGPENARFRIVREPVACSPCGVPYCRFERQACFEDLSSEKVFGACAEMLAGAQTALKS